MSSAAATTSHELYGWRVENAFVRMPVRADPIANAGCKRDTSVQRQQAWLVQSLGPTSLKQLNANASMLVRRDNKYVIRSSRMREAVQAFAPYFDVLEIDGRQNFSYETCYFDDANRTCYHDHQRGRRKRFKARIRKYTDTQLCFLELKFKDRRGITDKKRRPHPIDRYGRLDAAEIEYIRDTHRAQYGRDFDLALEPVIETHTRRSTLVAKEGGERMTIDFDLKFVRGERSFEVDQDIFIVETKSANANGIADKLLRGLHLHPTQRCSKYCLAMAALQLVEKHNSFLPAMRKIDVVSRAGTRLECCSA